MAAIKLTPLNIPELIINISLNLTISDVNNFKHTNKQIYNTIQDSNEFWRLKLIHDYGDILHKKYVSSGFKWRDIYLSALSPDGLINSRIFYLTDDTIENISEKFCPEYISIASLHDCIFLLGLDGIIRIIIIMPSGPGKKCDNTKSPKIDGIDIIPASKEETAKLLKIFKPPEISEATVFTLSVKNSKISKLEKQTNDDVIALLSDGKFIHFSTYEHHEISHLGFKLSETYILGKYNMSHVLNIHYIECIDNSPTNGATKILDVCYYDINDQDLKYADYMLLITKNKSITVNMIYYDDISPPKIKKFCELSTGTKHKLMLGLPGLWCDDGLYFYTVNEIRGYTFHGKILSMHGHYKELEQGVDTSEFTGSDDHRLRIFVHYHVINAKISGDNNIRTIVHVSAYGNQLVTTKTTDDEMLIHHYIDEDLGHDNMMYIINNKLEWGDFRMEAEGMSGGSLYDFTDKVRLIILK